MGSIYGTSASMIGNGGQGVVLGGGGASGGGTGTGTGTWTGMQSGMSMSSVAVSPVLVRIHLRSLLSTLR